MHQYIFILVIFATCSNALTFYLTEGKQRCFLDEYTANTVVIGAHQLLDKVQPNGGGVELSVLDPDNQVVLTKMTNSDEGKFTFTTKKQGRYQVCLKMSNSKGWFGDKKQPLYFLRIKQGENQEFSSAAKESQITGLKQKIKSLQKQEDDFIKLQQMNRENEDKLSIENIKINDNVFNATLIQIFVIIGAGIFQIYSLRRFFAQKIYY
ncbi:unnamed protein product [Paramecium pentaurelia]|uniref:GOLD domain-containing protein n=1 Tax=Paramecium pentaurelia TaxID=43138 RepID=A0A8S1SQB3_9CILI|nr:unnamed protein product [Paramecium pentaurelia]